MNHGFLMNNIWVLGCSVFHHVLAVALCGLRN
jgi:hypothetical protein